MQLQSVFATSIFVLAASLGWSCTSTSQANHSIGAVDETVMMEKWTAFGTPGAEHQRLDAKVGRWNYTVRFWPAPGMPSSESTGTNECTWTMDGRFLRDETTGTYMGQPFHGSGTTGYDNLKQKYVTTWIDNMGTGIAFGEGTYDASKHAFTYESQSPDVVGGKYVPTRSVETMITPDQWTMEMFGPDQDGKEFKMMEIVYKRAR